MKKGWTFRIFFLILIIAEIALVIVGQVFLPFVLFAFGIAILGVKSYIKAHDGHH